MLNVSKLGELDLSTIDLGVITPEEREAVIREAIRRGRAERNKVMRDLFRRLRSWWRPRAATRSHGPDHVPLHKCPL